MFLAKSTGLVHLNKYIATALIQSSQWHSHQLNKQSTMSDEADASHTTLPQSREFEMENPHTNDTEVMADEAVNDSAAENNEAGKKEEDMIITEHSPAMRPIFLGNLSRECTASDVEGIFERPVVDARGGDGELFVIWYRL